MLHTSRTWFFGALGTALLACQAPLLAQFIPPSGGDPVAIACPKGPANGNGINPLDAWAKGKDVASIEGDGVFGIGNWGHTLEALECYCKASAAGNAIAAYDIAEIFREGYVVNSVGPGGRVITKHYLSDLPTAFYWYQLSANRGFTKAMLSVAQYYGIGDQTLKGSGVPKDLDKAASWLSRAADKGDTAALTMLAMRHAGMKTALWAMNIPITPDKAKALKFAASAMTILTRFSPDCSSADAVKDMAGQLPDASQGRNVRWASVVEVHGSSATGPIQLECLLTLTAAPSSQQDDPLINQFYRLIHGGSVNSWTYSITQIPGIQNSIMFRETATQAMTEGLEELSALVQLISPPAGPQAAPTARQNSTPPPNASAAPMPRSMPQPNSLKLPGVIHFCAQHCLTFTVENGQFTNYTNLPGQWNEKRVFTVEAFTRESVIIHRTDTGSNPMTAIYAGRMSEDGNSVSGPGWKITWGAALNTLPKDDQELQTKGGWR